MQIKNLLILIEIIYINRMLELKFSPTYVDQCEKSIVGKKISLPTITCQFKKKTYFCTGRKQNYGMEII